MNKMNLVLFAVLAAGMVYQVSPVTISGKVKNSTGSGIEGVAVRFGKAGLSTTTGSDGSFTLMGSSSTITEPQRRSTHVAGLPFELKNNTVIFNGTEPVEIKMTVYGCNGRLLFSHHQIAKERCSLLLPQMARGVQFYRIVINQIVYSFKALNGTTMNTLPASSIKRRTVESAEQPEDILLFSKEGYQQYRLEIPLHDTSDIMIIMIPLDTGTVTDIEGHVYTTVRFGKQIWTAGNLYTTKYNDGKSIPMVSDSIAWSETTSPAYCFYQYTTDPAEQKKWGALYNWYAVNTGKLAPAGWHVSTDADWDTLQNYLIANGYNFSGTTDENAIAKSLAVKTDWKESIDAGSPGNDMGSNSASGFLGLPNGYCEITGIIYYRNWYAFWWTTTPQDSTFVKIRGISYSSSDLKTTAFTKGYGLSVRLVKD